MKAPEHQAFGKERLWRHDWVSNQREVEKGWAKCSTGRMKELSVKGSRSVSVYLPGCCPEEEREKKEPQREPSKGNFLYLSWRRKSTQTQRIKNQRDKEG